MNKTDNNRGAAEHQPATAAKPGGAVHPDWKVLAAEQLFSGNWSPNEVWNGVSLYGPQAEIDRFKQLCIVPIAAEAPEQADRIDFNRIAPLPDDLTTLQERTRWMTDSWGTNDEPWNFRVNEEEPGIYRIAFDTAGGFPIPILQRLAELFPAVAFDCNCIESTDEFMGFGWFNGPPGGEIFADHYAVPQGYWDGGTKREPIAERRYQALKAALITAVRSGEVA